MYVSSMNEHTFSMSLFSLIRMELFSTTCLLSCRRSSSSLYGFEKARLIYTLRFSPLLRRIVIERILRSFIHPSKTMSRQFLDITLHSTVIQMTFTYSLNDIWIFESNKTKFLASYDINLQNYTRSKKSGKKSLEPEQRQTETKYLIRVF